MAKMTDDQKKWGIFLAANTHDGVFGTMICDYPSVTILHPIDFYQELPKLEEGDLIFTFIDGRNEDVFDKIVNEYRTTDVPTNDWHDDYTQGWECDGCGALCQSDCHCHDYD